MFICLPCKGAMYSLTLEIFYFFSWPGTLVVVYNVKLMDNGEPELDVSRTKLAFVLMSIIKYKMKLKVVSIRFLSDKFLLFNHGVNDTWTVCCIRFSYPHWWGGGGGSPWIQQLSDKSYKLLRCGMYWLKIRIKLCTLSLLLTVIPYNLCNALWTSKAETPTLTVYRTCCMRVWRAS